MLTENSSTNINSSSSYHTESKNNTPFKIDIKQAQKQLKVLGYSDEDTIYLRSFAAKPKDHFKNVKPKKYERTIATLPTTQPEGTGFYFVVNGDGHKDADVKQWRALFVEWDDKPIQEQFNAWRNKLPCPSMQIRTRHSVHTYWVFEEPVSVELGKQLQEDAIAFLQADPSNKNPSRVLRLAGSWHIEKMASGYELPPHQCTLETCSGHSYSYEELRSLIPSKSQQDPPKKQKTNTLPPHPQQSNTHPLGSIPPLDIFLTKSDRELFMHGARSGSRNASGLKLAKNLIGTANRLEQMGIQFEGKPYDYFWGYCQRCDGKDWSSKEWDEIWKSSQQKNPTPSLTDDAIENCLKAWQRKNNPHQQKVQTVLEHPEIKIIGKTPDKGIPDKPPTFEREDKIPYGQMDWVQKSFVDLFGDKPWICIDDQLHEWNGKYYEPREDVDIEREIVNWLCAYEEPVFDRKGNLTDMVIRKTKPENVAKILKWAKLKTGYNSNLINPPGLNLSNGILKIEFDKQKPKWKLVPHDWRQLYTYCSDAEYNPDAPKEDCDKLLSVLEPEQRDIFLKLVASSINLQTLRGFPKIGRIPAALCIGQGSNGKDSLRETVRLLFGNKGIGSYSFTDFKQYDRGTKFEIASLINNVRLSWSAENTKFLSLDNLISLRKAISGETMTSRSLHKEGKQFDCNTVFFFNVNELPLIHGDMTAIKSRYTILEFTKTIKKNANPDRGEIEEDPRFKHNKNFIKNNILSAFLNYVLNALSRLPEEGIDTTATEAAFEQARRENNHLITFCDEMGLVEAEGVETPTKDIYDRLLWWYEHENGVLSFSGERKIWEEQAHPLDKNIKAINQLFPRLEKLFPKITRSRSASMRKIKGIAFNPENALICVTPFHQKPEKVDNQSLTADDAGKKSCVIPASSSPPTASSIQISVSSMNDASEQAVTQDDAPMTHPETLEPQEIRGNNDAVTQQFEETEKLITQLEQYMNSCQSIAEYDEMEQLPFFSPELHRQAWQRLTLDKRSQIKKWSSDRDVLTEQLTGIVEMLKDCDNAGLYKEIEDLAIAIRDELLQEGVSCSDLLKEAISRLSREEQQKINSFRNAQPAPPAPPDSLDTDGHFKIGDPVVDLTHPKWGIGDIVGISQEDIKVKFPRYAQIPMQCKPDHLAKKGDTVSWFQRDCLALVKIVRLEQGNPVEVQGGSFIMPLPVNLEDLRLC